MIDNDYSSEFLDINEIRKDSVEVYDNNDLRMKNEKEEYEEININFIENKQIESEEKDKINDKIVDKQTDELCPFDRIKNKQNNFDLFYNDMNQSINKYFSDILEKKEILIYNKINFLRTKSEFFSETELKDREIFTYKEKY